MNPNALDRDAAVRELVVTSLVVGPRRGCDAFARHSIRAGENAALVGLALGLEADQIEALRWTGRLHDVGKAGICPEILGKPSALTPDEFAAVRCHPKIGADAVIVEASGLADVADIADGIRSHHERWDGKGYPYGLSMTDIPLFGRIVAVVDAFDAMTEPRPYRDSPRSLDAALVEILCCAGSAFDPHVALVFERMCVEGIVDIDASSTAITT